MEQMMMHVFDDEVRWQDNDDGSSILIMGAHRFPVEQQSDGWRWGIQDNSEAETVWIKDGIANAADAENAVILHLLDLSELA
jgi:hypothetical protein